MLKVISQTSSSARLSLNSSGLDTDSSANYNVTCTSLIDDSSVTDSLRNHLVTLLDVTLKNVSELFVQPLAASTNYTCCLESNEQKTCVEDIHTLQTAAGHGLSLEVAGVIGGVVGAVVTLLLIAGIAGIAIGTAILIRRKRAIIRSKNRPILRTNSKIYRKRNDQQEAEMSPASIIEENLKPPSLPTAKPSSRRRQHQQNNLRSKGPLVPPNQSYQGNLYTPQNTETVDSEFEDYDDDEFAEPEETYETMLSTADNVAYKNRPKAQHAHKQRQLPEEYYDYLPS